MAAIVASRVVAEIYRGVDFPSDWVERDGSISVGMARDLVVSVAALFDVESRPVALCWQVDGRDEKFVYAYSQRDGDNSLLAELHNDLAQESLRWGAADLLATMLWAPDKLRPDQGQSVHGINFFGRGMYSSVVGWSVPPRTLVAQSDNLLVMTRYAEDGLALPLPTTAEDMHRHLGAGDTHTLIVLPTKSAANAPKEDVGRRMVLFFGGLLVLGIVISAFLLNSG
jgi:hypothetical protein